nr:hypothetical protein FVER53263_10290 [Fusarium verticillioides]
MDAETYGVKPGQHIPGQHIPGQIVHRCLEAYARHFDIYDKIRFGHKLETAEHQENGGWVLRHGQISDSIWRDKVGLGYGIFICHQSIRVNWVIRESGHGPSWNAPPYVTPLKKWLEKLAHIRMLTWFSPCNWGAAYGYVKTRNFYHGTFIERAIVDKFWSIRGNDVITPNKYDSHSETAKLKPWSNAMFVATSIGILNYEKDFFEVVKEGLVKIHIADVERLSWKHVPPIRFLPDGITEDIGMPHTPSPSSFPYASILDQVDKEIFDKVPRLKDQPIQKVQNSKYHTLLEGKGLSSNDDITPSTELTPYTLYHFIIPPSSQFLKTRDIAFVGMVVNFSHPIVSNVQSLWMNAFFDDMIPALPRNPSPEFSEAGTAVCISPDGVLLTCAHCVAEEPSELTAHTSYVLLSSHGKVVSAKVVAWDPIRDLALLQIDKAERLRRPFPCARVATSPPKFSTELLCIGHPGSEDLEAEHSGVKTEYDTLVLTEGTFRGLDKDQDPQDNSDIGALKHSCWTYWGHSGAGLFDRKTGALVGVHSSWDDKTGMRRGVPLEAVVAFVKEVEASKREDFAENWRWD